MLEGLLSFISIVNCIFIFIITLAFNPIEPRSVWKWTHHVNSDSWYSPNYNDSMWFQSAPGSFFSIEESRFYRFSKSISNRIIRRFSAFELFVKHLYNIDVFINGALFLSRRSMLVLIVIVEGFLMARWLTLASVRVCTPILITTWLLVSMCFQTIQLSMLPKIHSLLIWFSLPSLHLHQMICDMSQHIEMIIQLIHYHPCLIMI